MPMRQLDQRQPTLEADHATLRRFLEQFRNNPIVFGELYQVTVTAGNTTGKAFHGLGRNYIGGMIVSTSILGLGDAVIVAAPEVMQTYSLGDPATEFFVSIATPASSDTTFTVWLF